MNDRAGLYHLTGEPDSGKTTLALTCGIPIQDMLFLDNDMKTQRIADNLSKSGKGFGKYVNLPREMRANNLKNPLDFFNMTMDILEKSKQKYQCIIFDEWTRIEDGIRAKSMSIMKDISPLTENQIRAMTQVTWVYTHQYYAQVLDTLMTFAPTVFLITHIREKYMNNKKTGVYEARGQRPLLEKANMRLWLRHNADPADGGAPIGLVLKRISTFDVDENGILKPVNVLPLRIKPCTWKKIDWYFDNPVGDRKPEPYEMPDAFEQSVLYGVLTEDQKHALELAIIESKRELDDNTAIMQEIGLDEDQKSYIREQIAGNVAITDIAADLGVLPVVISRWLVNNPIEEAESE